MVDMKTYIHYGSTFFDYDRFRSPKNLTHRNKPSGGFWASPIDAQYGWKEWNEHEQFVKCDEENSFKFILKNDAKVFHIYSSEDIKKMPMQDIIYEKRVNICPDFEEMIELGYDAIEYHLSEEHKYQDSIFDDSIYFLLYGWDCDSILILNPDVILKI